MNEKEKNEYQLIEELVIPELKVIKSTSGVEITLPILYKGHNLQMNRLVTELIDIKKDTLVGLINETDEDRVDKLFQIMAIYTGKPIKWLEENFSIEDVVGELQRFFGIVRYAKITNKIKEYQKTVSRLIPNGNL